MSFKFRQSTLGVLTLVLFSISAFAQVNLPETVISATGFETPAEQIGSSVTVITEQQIQRDQRRTVADLLATVPGLNVVQTGSPGGQTSVFIRGLAANQTKILVDGIEMSDPTNPNRAFDFSSLVTADIERIEILRGPQSGLYGSDAMGGVISITTKKGSGPAKWRTMVEGGSFDTFNKSAQVSGGTDRTNYAFTVSNTLANSTPVTPLSLLGAGQRRINDRTNNWTYSGKVGVDLTEDFGLNFVGRYMNASLFFTNSDFNNNLPFSDYSDSVARQFAGKAEAVWKMFDGRVINYIGATYTDIFRTVLDPDANYNRFDGDRAKYYWRSETQVAKGHKLLLGVERDFERANGLSFGSEYFAVQGNTGAYAELHSAITDRFFIAFNARHDVHDAWGGHTTYRIAPAYLIRETGTKLKASYGTGFHAPSLDQRFNPFIGFTNLKPEESKGWDYGFEQSLWQRRLEFGVTWFNNDVKNLIDYDTNTFANFNINFATTQGYEAFVAARFSDQFQVRADYTFVGVSSDGPVQLRRRPREKTSVSAVWQPTEKFSLVTTAVWVSGWVDVPRFGFSSSPAPGYNTVNLAANYALTPNVTLFGRIDNLLDQHYQNPLGFEKTGIGFYAGIRTQQ